MADDLVFEAVFGFGFAFFHRLSHPEIPERCSSNAGARGNGFAHSHLLGIVSRYGQQTPTQFYVARFLLGRRRLFQASSISPTSSQRDRARALSGLVMAVPFSLALGAPVSAVLLQVNWLGLAGWKWMFLLEGLPAVVLGVVTLFSLADRPRDARWLTPEERNHLIAELEAEARAKEAKGQTSVWQALRLPNVWLLALGIFATNTGGSTSEALLYSGLYYGCGLAGVFLSGQSSDRTGDRKWHASRARTDGAVPHRGDSGQPFWLVMGWLATGLPPILALPFWALQSPSRRPRPRSASGSSTWPRTCGTSATTTWVGSSQTASAKACASGPADVTCSAAIIAFVHAPRRGTC